MGTHVRRTWSGAFRRTSIALRRGIDTRFGLARAQPGSDYPDPYPESPYQERDFIFLKVGFIGLLSVPVLLAVLAMLSVTHSDQTAEAQSAQASVESVKAQPPRPAPGATKSQIAVLQKENRRLTAALTQARRTIDDREHVIAEQRSRIDDLHGQLVAVKTGMARPDVTQAAAVRREGPASRKGLSHSIAQGQERAAPLRLAVSDTKASASPKARVPTHTVVAGDTLYAIARRFKVTVSELREWNDLASERLSIGQSIRVGPRGGTPDTGRAARLLSAVAASG